MLRATENRVPDELLRFVYDSHSRDSHLAVAAVRGFSSSALNGTRSPAEQVLSLRDDHALRVLPMVTTSMCIRTRSAHASSRLTVNCVQKAE
ncbi:hypothetical protein [Streptomyces venezuelae]|uniref:hypothetical protein n=1 Tax=Streptomyces venezuelae TaxID=54571 RepID=UPI00278C7EE6|nr:hypothetical protein [Streptomyces venezuelae]